MEKRLFTPENITSLKKNEVFVFGSNLNGHHIGGAALLASTKFGAIEGQAEGRMGNSYAIPTLDKNYKKLSLDQIKESVWKFINYAGENSDLTFYFTKIGTGIAGFDIKEIASLMKIFNFPLNVTLPVEFAVTKGYKVFNPDWTCRRFQYKVGDTFIMNDFIFPCDSGFHFCESLDECYKYYDYNKDNKVAEISVLGYTKTNDGKKFCTNAIKIEREISWDKVDELVNTGRNNMGVGNAGDYNAGSGNAGSRNAGDYNAGSGNAGDYNAGDYNAGSGNAGSGNAGSRNAGSGNAGDYNAGSGNAGSRNAGDYNAGSGNAGDYNAGSGNAGSRNAGDYNAGSGNAGVFCTQKTETIPFFNKPSSLTWEDWERSRVYYITSNRLNLVKWVSWDNMTNGEKKEFPKAYVCGGFYRKINYFEAWKNLWDSLDNDERMEFSKLPNFDAKIFKEITGIDFKDLEIKNK